MMTVLESLVLVASVFVTLVIVAVLLAITFFTLFGVAVFVGRFLEIRQRRALSDAAAP